MPFPKRIYIFAEGVKYNHPRRPKALYYDVQGLPNPHGLGKDAYAPKVVEFFIEHADKVKACTQRIITDIEAMKPALDMPLEVVVRCFGGKHRSPTVALRLQYLLEKAGSQVTLSTPDLGRE